MKIRIRTNSDGWIVAVGSGLADYDHEIETDKDIEPRDPSKHEKAWNYNNGDPELRETGNTPGPSQEERIKRLENAAGVGGQGQTGIANRLDDLEQRISDLEDQV